MHVHRVGWEPDGPKVTWFPAIDPKSAAGFPNPACRGCFLSHLAILNMLRNAGHKRALVLEDDCEFAPDFAGRQAEMASLLESTPWAIAYLGHVESIPGPPRLIPYGPNANIITAHCYAVAGDVLPRLSAYLEAMTLRAVGSSEGGPMHLDGAFNWFRRHNPDVLTVLAAPSLAHQRSSRSDLAPSWFDRMPVLRDAVGTARAWRRRRRVKV